jgi:hypothetical protein
MNTSLIHQGGVERSVGLGCVVANEGSQIGIYLLDRACLCDNRSLDSPHAVPSMPGM